MICPHIVNISVLLGGILSWGLMWPLIETRSGDWYDKELSPTSMNGLQGYKVIGFPAQEKTLINNNILPMHICKDVCQWNLSCTCLNRSSLPLP